jgi:hypothetical protein
MLFVSLFNLCVSVSAVVNNTSHTLNCEFPLESMSFC